MIWLALGLLAFTLVQVLARGRARALRMVEEKTGQLRHQALHDALTGLPNRALIMDRAEQMLVHARRAGVEASAMFIDLDGFKGVNDTFGHPVGDELLREVAARITGVLRETDTIGRLGGDEFVVLVEGGAEQIAERILAVLREPFDLGTGGRRSRSRRRSASPPATARPRSDLLRDADIALYEAKGAGRNRYAEFRHEMHIAAHDRLELENDLRGAIAPRRAVPRLPADPRPRDRRGRRGRGAAALAAPDARARSRRPSSSRSPRRAALIVEIGAWVLETACEQAAAWAADGTPIRDLGQRLGAPARRSGPARRPCATRCCASGLEPASARSLEITETALMRDPEAAADILRELKASACTWRSTTSAPATRRSPTCSSCRSTR